MPDKTPGQFGIVQPEGKAFYRGTVARNYQPVWICDHEHGSKEEAIACAKRKLTTERAIGSVS